MKDIAEGEGDLRKRLKVDPNDEFGQLAGWFNSFAEKLQFSISNVSKDTENLTVASKDLEEIAQEFSLKSKQVKEKSENANRLATLSEHLKSVVSQFQV